MITKEIIARLAEDHLKDGPVFLTGVKISSDNKVNVFIDGDNGVSIQDCMALSRAIEGSLDRDREDYSLDVSSHGAATPLVFPRQYKRHTGRELEILKTDNSRLEGKLLQSNDAGVEIEVTSREAKPLGKGKTTVVRTFTVPYSEMKETKIKLKY